MKRAIASSWAPSIRMTRAMRNNIKRTLGSLYGLGMSNPMRHPRLTAAVPLSSLKSPSDLKKPFKHSQYATEYRYVHLAESRPLHLCVLRRFLSSNVSTICKMIKISTLLPTAVCPYVVLVYCTNLPRLPRSSISMNSPRPVRCPRHTYLSRIITRSSMPWTTISP